MKQRHFKFIGFFALLSIFFSSCWFLGPSIKGNGDVKEQVRSVGEFDQIKVSRGMNVSITQGCPAKVVVIADSNLHDVIETEVRGGVLEITVKENIRRAKEKKVMVTIDKLSGVEASSGSNAWSQSIITSENMKLHASSGGNLNMEINAKILKTDCSSGGNIKLSGTAKEAELEASSGANLKAGALKADECIMRASSGGNISSTVMVKLDAKASSGGNIVYYGEPNTKNINSSSGGNISHK
jgi:hypothetical protein